MTLFIIPFIGAGASFVVVLLIAHLVAQRSSQVLAQLGNKEFYRKFLDRWPVNPLTKRLTNQTKLLALARAAHEEQVFTFERVGRYKEMSLWASIFTIIILLPSAPTDQIILVAVLLISLSFRWPEWYLARRAVRVQRDLEKGLVYIVDLLRLYVSAGRNVEQAVRSIAPAAGERWGRVLNRVVYRIDTGLPFEVAFQAVASSVTLPDFSRFLLALKQSRILGASLGGTLSVQANLLRARRRQKGEEQARTAAVKVALPLVLCIFPALLIIYLAPAVLQLWLGL
ncbi:MAG: hypothetical protein EXS55_04430 [Candidatus Magasanikbacteria bacterium]|nr:hypothetical protein [Candidatus Magasanikbacteria bacterium]